jgi:predicted dehydrogenase
MAEQTSITHLRAGVIGTGFIGPVHVEALLRLGIKVTAVCDETSRAQALAARFGIPEIYGDFDVAGLVASPNVDVVHITSPNRYHHAQALQVIAGGKACICEKPLAMTTRESAEIVEAVKRHRAVFSVNYNYRFSPAVLQMRHLVQSGALGDIIHVDGSYMQDWLLEATDYNWRLLPEEGGKLRAVADIGTHWMDAASFVLGRRITRVLADLRTFHKTRQRPVGEVQTFSGVGTSTPPKTVSYPVKTEDHAALMLEWRGGIRGTATISQVAAGCKNQLKLEIYGTAGSASWNSEAGETIAIGRRHTANEVAFRNTPAFGPAIAGYTDYPAGHPEGFPDTFKMHFRSVYTTIARGGRGDGLFATAADGHHEVALCEAVMASAKAKGWVSV